MKKYKINQIFESIQGEGSKAGELAVFIRFSICNMKCAFCDTDFDKYTEMNIHEITREASRYNSRNIVFTGGEPSLQLTDEIVEEFSLNGWKTHIETNGTNKIDQFIDHISVSPKGFENWRQIYGNDLKFLIDLETVVDLPLIMERTQFNNYYLQPIDGPNQKENIDLCIELIKENPKWKLSLQIHKFINIE